MLLQALSLALLAVQDAMKNGAKAPFCQSTKSAVSRLTA